MTVQHPQPPITVRTFAQRFSATRRGARLARLLAAHQFTVWGVPRGTAVFDSATLAVAELAANAVLHGRVPGRDFELVLVYDGGGGVLRVEVADTHPAPPVPSPAAVAGAEPECGEEERGRGLLLVEAVADRWGVRERCGPGKTVWAEFALKAVPGGFPGPFDPVEPAGSADTSAPVDGT
ncbi:ATP-binding protein [Streptomyces barkulensis]|uniref:ATP-binding protein n=1 Tax=Streptomyces barkulensis TaxID=1257026 RepID=UPI000C6D1734|nr:ATP-binding protein [Streptomyces barkulensis]